MSNYSDTILADNPVAYWRLNEMTSTVMVDQTGNHHGTWRQVNGDAWSGYGDQNVTGAVGGDSDKAYSPRTYGYGSYVTVPYDPVFELDTPFSLEGWVKLGGAASAMCLFSARDHQSFYVSKTTGKAELFVGQALDTNTSGTYLSDGNWHHVVATYSGTANSGKIYIDGIDRTNHPGAGGTPTTGVADFAIGSTGATPPPAYTFGLPDTIDELAVYDYVLSQTQVSNHYANGRGPVRVVSSV